jgi:hypothetical protein
MNTQYTLGPWAVRDDDEVGQVSVVGGSQIVIATVRTATVEPGDGNASLIAAAPELLEALIDARAELAKRTGEFGTDWDGTSTLIRMDAAIAKATTI